MPSTVSCQRRRTTFFSHKFFMWHTHYNRFVVSFLPFPTMPIIVNNQSKKEVEVQTSSRSQRIVFPTLASSPAFGHRLRRPHPPRHDPPRRPHDRNHSSLKRRIAKIENQTETHIFRSTPTPPKIQMKETNYKTQDAPAATTTGAAAKTTKAAAEAKELAANNANTYLAPATSSASATTKAAAAYSYQVAVVVVKTTATTAVPTCRKSSRKIYATKKRKRSNRIKKKDFFTFKPACNPS